MPCRGLLTPRTTERMIWRRCYVYYKSFRITVHCPQTKSSLSILIFLYIGVFCSVFILIKLLSQTIYLSTSCFVIFRCIICEWVVLFFHFLIFYHLCQKVYIIYVFTVYPYNLSNKLRALFLNSKKMTNAFSFYLDLNYLKSPTIK